MFVRLSAVLLLLLFVGGCTPTLNTLAPTISSHPTQVADTEFPDATDSHWTCCGRAQLEAPPEEVFPNLLNPLLDAENLEAQIASDNLPEGVKISIDHSASRSGPDKWGIGSVVQVQQKRRKDSIVVFECDSPHRVVHRVETQFKKRTIRSTNLFTLEPTPDGGTILTTHWFSSANYTPWWNWSQQRIHELVMRRDLVRLVSRFGGEVISVEEGIAEDYFDTPDELPLAEVASSKE